jgi:MFS family permease
MIGPVLAPFITMLFLVLGAGLINTLVPLRAPIEGFSQSIIGLFSSSHYLGMLFGAVIAPRLIAGVGHIRVFAAFGAVCALCMLGHAIFVDPFSWILLRGINGFGYAALFTATDSWVNAKVSNEKRGQMMALSTITQYGGNALAQQSLRLAAPGGFQLFSLAAAAFIAAIIPLALTRSVPPDRPTQPRLQLRWLIGVSPVAVAACFAAGFGNGSFWTLAPSLGISSGLDTIGVGTMMTVAIIASAIGQFPAGKLSDLMDRRYVMATCGGLAALMSACIVVSSLWFPSLLFFFIFGFGLIAFTLYPVATAHANDMGGSENSVSISSGLLLIYCIGATLGPLLAAYLMEKLAPAALFVVIGSTHLLLVAFALYRRRQRPVAPSEPAPPPPVVPSADGPDMRRPADPPGIT